MLPAKLSAGDLISQETFVLQSPEGGEEKPLLGNEHAKGCKDHSSRHLSQKDNVNGTFESNSQQHAVPESLR